MFISIRIAGEYAYPVIGPLRCAGAVYFLGEDLVIEAVSFILPGYDASSAAIQAYPWSPLISRVGADEHPVFCPEGIAVGVKSLGVYVPSACGLIFTVMPYGEEASFGTTLHCAAGHSGCVYRIEHDLGNAAGPSLAVDAGNKAASLGQQFPIAAAGEPVTVFHGDLCFTAAACLQLQFIIEPGWLPISDMQIDNYKDEANLLHLLVGNTGTAQQLHASHLEPHRINTVVDHSALVSLGVAHPEVYGMFVHIFSQAPLFREL